MPREYRFRARVTYRGSKHASVSAAKGINYWHWVGLPTSSYYSVGSESQWVGFALAGRSSGGWLVPVRGIAPNTVSRCPGVAARSTPLSDWPIARRTARRGVSPSQRSTPPESRSRSGSRRLLSRERPSRSHCRWRRPTASRSSVRTPAHLLRVATSRRRRWRSRQSRTRNFSATSSEDPPANPPKARQSAPPDFNY